MAATILPQSASLPTTSNGLPACTMDHQVNVLLTTFAGLALPRTLAFQAKAFTPICDVLAAIEIRLPPIKQPLIITTTSNKQLLHSSHEPISTLLSDQSDSFLPLRLSARLCGGKGGFGSQLRAAGGRMSSRKKRDQQGQNPNGSNRNLDGRRLRTVDTAKKLAEYLENKPKIEAQRRQEREENLKKKIEDANRLEENIKSGKMGASQGRLDAEYVESKELAEERTREAVVKAMREGMLATDRTGSESSVSVYEKGSDDEAEQHSSGSSEEAKEESKPTGGMSCFGFDEHEDEDDDSEDEEPPAQKTGADVAYAGKGKGKAL